MAQESPKAATVVHRRSKKVQAVSLLATKAAKASCRRNQLVLPMDSPFRSARYGRVQFSSSRAFNEMETLTRPACGPIVACDFGMLLAGRVALWHYNPS